MADTRIFRITREWSGFVRGRKPTVEYGNRRVVSGKCGGGMDSWKHGPVVKVEATNAEATEGWTDVTSEFIESCGHPYPRMIPSSCSGTRQWHK